MCRTPRSYVLLLLLFFWYPWAALSLHIPQLSSLNQTELMASNPVTFCIRSLTFEVEHPVQADCDAAISRLPLLPGPAFFHPDAPDDDFSLPRYNASGTCWVSVSLVNEIVKASWPEIRARAVHLNTVCVAPTRAMSNMQGGSTHAGEEEGIVVSLLYADTGVNGGNGTLDGAFS